MSPLLTKMNMSSPVLFLYVFFVVCAFSDDAAFSS